MPIRSGMGAFVASAVALLAFYCVGIVFLDGFALDLGSFNFPTPRYLAFVAFWAVLGGYAASLLATGIATWLGSVDRFAGIRHEWQRIPHVGFVCCATGAAFAIPLAIRLWLLHSAPLADDESAYRFAAELLASGRLSVASPKLKLFFDQNFMINDGRLYPVYFLGWPLLMVPGIWIHAPGIVNPLLSALTVWPLSRVLEHFVGRSWARGGILLFLSAPLLQIAAATELSHTSCLMALTWCLWMCLRVRDGDAPAGVHAGFGLAFALAFAIRPQSTVALALPLLILWMAAVVRMREGRLRAVLAFAVPTLVGSALFLASLWAQNGSPLKIGYARYLEYIAANRFRFTTFGPSDFTALAGFDFLHPGEGIARAAVGMFRLNFDLFGWPCSFVMLWFAMRRAGILWAMIACFMLLMLFQRDWGIDTFGPVHAFELALPILVLTVVGARRLSEDITWAPSAAGRWAWSALSPSLLASLIVTAWLGFVPLRLETIRQIAAHLNIALRAPERAGIHDAVVFSPVPFAPPCGFEPHHFVFFRPTNDPDLRNDIVWVNDLGVDENRRLLETFPGRAGYQLRWTDKCDVSLTRVGP